MPSKQNQELASDLRTVVTRLVKKLRTKSTFPVPLSLTERSVAGLLLQYDSLQPSELAAMEKVTTQSMSQILARLQELGLILRKPSAEDKRKVLVSISKKGKELVEATRSQRDEWLLDALEHACTTDEQAALRKALPALMKLVDYED